MADDVFSQIHAEAQQPAGDVFAQIHAEQSAAPSLSSDDVQRLHQLYDSRPLWRKVMGSQPAGDSLSDSDKALLQRARDIGKTGTQQLTEGVVSGMAEGAKTGAKMAPFMALPGVGAMADVALGGGAAGAAANMAVQGGGAAGLTALEGGNKQAAADAAMLGMMGPVGDKVAGALLPKAGAIAEGLAGRLYQSALKPPPGSYTTPEVQSMLRTGMDAGIPVSQKGADKLSDLISKLNDDVKAQIAAGPESINANAVASRADQIKPRFANQVNASEDLNAIEASKQQFLAERGAKPGVAAQPPQATGILDQYGKPVMTAGVPARAPTPAPPMTAADAQNIKQGTYQQLRKKYGELSSATVETQKSLARGIKEELETVFPGIRDTNAQLSDYYGLEPALERAVRRIDNHELFGLGTRLAAGTGAAVGGAAMGAEGALGGSVVAGLIQKTISDPAVKSKLAIALSRTGKMAPAAANAQIASYIAQLANAAGAGMSPGDVLQLGGGPIALPSRAEAQPNP